MKTLVLGLGNPILTDDGVGIHVVREVARAMAEAGMPQFALVSWAALFAPAKTPKDVIDRLNRDFPQIRIVPIFNTGDYIQRSISSVSYSAIHGGCLAILVLLFFLRNLRSTLVISVSIPNPSAPMAASLTRLSVKRFFLPVDNAMIFFIFLPLLAFRLRVLSAFVVH